jgi:hypothetical protein
MPLTVRPASGINLTSTLALWFYYQVPNLTLPNLTYPNLAQPNLKLKILIYFYPYLLHSGCL